MKRLLKHYLETTDVNIGGIFLEEHKGTLLKSLAGLDLGVAAHLPDAGVSNDEIKAAVRRIIRRDDRLHIYSHFGSDDLNVLLDTIRFMVAAAGCRIVFLDHISMVVSGLEGDDERRKLDWLVTHLQMLVEDLNFALIFVSHVNDAGQTRGSRYITKVADTTVGLSRNLISPDPGIRNSINVLFEYNRFTGRTGPVEPLEFDPDKYTLEERGVKNERSVDRNSLPVASTA
jgi:twinkle protein